MILYECCYGSVGAKLGTIPLYVKMLGGVACTLSVRVLVACSIYETLEFRKLNTWEFLTRGMTLHRTYKRASRPV